MRFAIGRGPSMSTMPRNGHSRRARRATKPSALRFSLAMNSPRRSSWRCRPRAVPIFRALIGPFSPSMAPSKAEAARGKEPRASEAAPSAEAPNDDAPKSAATGSCTLNANSIPHSKVLVDGRPVGLTPKVGITVPAGQHTVLFVGDNSQKTTTVTCSSGEKKTVSVRL